jgi:PhoH-like ATPase
VECAARRTAMIEEKKKLYVLDTNVLVHDPDAIFGFAHSMVGIPIMVLEELDKFKIESSQRGFNSREVIRHLDMFRERGFLGEGVPLDNGGSLQVLFIPLGEEECAWSLPEDIVDNQILYTAYCKKRAGYDVRFVSKDINARVKSDAIGIPATDYIKDTVSQEELYKGWIAIQVPPVQLKKEFPDDLLTLPKEIDLKVNEFVLVESRNNPFNYILFRYLGQGKFKSVRTPPLRWPLEARNPQQLMALDLLFDPEVQLVTLIGPAGTGKTFLALLAALHQILIEHDYEKILVTRPVIPLGPDIGYLPGDIHEKLHSWMQPIYDNMDFIAHSINVASQMAIYRDEGTFKGKAKKKLHREKGIPSLDELIKEGKVSLEAITYMRGRSIPYQFIIIDEVQNLTPHEVKTLISRVGEGSKIVLAGDPYQIDSPYLDYSSNGLIVASTKFKGQSIFGTVFLESSERSELSKLAGELL